VGSGTAANAAGWRLGGSNGVRPTAGISARSQADGPTGIVKEPIASGMPDLA